MAKQEPFINGAQFHADKAHGPYPEHMDIRQNLEENFNQKLRVGTDSKIISDEFEFGDNFYKKRY